MKCKKCKAELDELAYYRQIEITGILSIDKNGSDEWNDDYEPFQHATKEEYCCIECGKVLFTNSDKAIDFLKGGELNEERRSSCKIKRDYQPP